MANTRKVKEERALIEVRRLEELHVASRAMRRRIQKETRVKKISTQPGEVSLKKNTAVLLKIGVPGISYSDIADRLGETRSTVKEWFKSDPDVKDFYQWAVDNLKESSLKLMQTYALEAVETLVLLMRYGSEKYMFEASREILDRVGVPKVMRSENENTNINAHKWADRDALVSEIRELDPEQQEEALEALEKFEELLAKHANSKNGNSNGEVELSDEDLSGLHPISRVESDDDDEEDDED